MASALSTLLLSPSDLRRSRLRFRVGQDFLNSVRDLVKEREREIVRQKPKWLGQHHDRNCRVFPLSPAPLSSLYRALSPPLARTRGLRSAVFAAATASSTFCREGWRPSRSSVSRKARRSAEVVGSLPCSARHFFRWCKMRIGYGVCVYLWLGKDLVGWGREWRWAVRWQDRKRATTAGDVPRTHVEVDRVGKLPERRKRLQQAQVRHAIVRMRLNHCPRRGDDVSTRQGDQVALSKGQPQDLPCCVLPALQAQKKHVDSWQPSTTTTVERE